MKPHSIVLFCFAVLLLVNTAGCETVNSRIRSDLDAFNALSSDHRNFILQGQIQIGFSMEEVFFAWGKPNHEQITETSKGRKTTWIYTRTESDQPTVKKKWYNPATASFEYSYDPFMERREFIIRDAVFVNDRVHRFTIYPDTPLWPTVTK